MAKARILCVDDDRPTVTIIAGILKKEGYEVETALDGNEALRKVRAFKPDLVVLDIMMPGTDGYQVCRRLKANPNTAKIGVIMLTAKGGVDENIQEAEVLAANVQDRLRGFEAGALEFLTKPVKARELLQGVKAALWICGFPV